MTRIGVATFTRADYGELSAVMHQIRRQPGLELLLYVGGTHLLPQFGETARDIERDGFPVAARIPMAVTDDSPASVSRFVAAALAGFAEVFGADRPDVLVLLGDRAEILAPAIAATVARIPIAHISGGEVTEGAIDNQVRDAVSKLSHLHFVAMEAAAARLVAMGEESWRVFVTGDPGLDTVMSGPRLDRPALEAALSSDLAPPVIVATYHPTTLGGAAADEITALLDAIESQPGTVIFTSPNADAGHLAIEQRIEAFVARHTSARNVRSLGHQLFHSLLAHADLMLGNSSSGIWESPSFGLPVVNVGDRQRGRVRAANVIDCPADVSAIREAMARGLSDAFRAKARRVVNPYGDGNAAARIVEILSRAWPPDTLLRKQGPDSGRNKEAGGR